ncbi:uncharacterized protein M421DRAFT_286838 [Didymella exigua CBS 183.55]|uniref:Uncharacterized protein n=1 Tax=Didymella exigua CBS 183.55 TaxID=1150837 RepID=A0A6A5RXE8_9PLEO|nr:uncharacterized protein M421DRAFT_286838 [Didymella exigua CBS 183.55]KAF1932219.1 hypothetical protein M421DRAFT_286838 [Didymella exigua CBS 183.55]
MAEIPGQATADAPVFGVREGRGDGDEGGLMGLGGGDTAVAQQQLHEIPAVPRPDVRTDRALSQARRRQHRVLCALLLFSLFLFPLSFPSFFSFPRGAMSGSGAGPDSTCRL